MLNFHFKIRYMAYISKNNAWSDDNLVIRQAISLLFENKVFKDCKNTVNKAHYRTFKSSNKQVAIREAFDQIFWKFPVLEI